VLLGVVALLLVGLAVLLATARSRPEVAVPVVITIFTLQLVAWMLTPLIAFGADETVDPTRFALLPLRLPTLQRGLLVSSLVGYLPVANAVVLLGAVIALSNPWSALPLALVAAIVQLLTCVVLSRAASTSMASLMSSRRGRDLGMLVGLLIFALYMGLNFLLNSSAGAGVVTNAGRVADVLAWGPPGSLASLPSFVTAGDWGRVAAAVVLGIAPLLLGWWWWSVALRHSLSSVGSATESSAPSGTSRGSAVGGDVRGTSAVVAGRDRLLVWRDPMRRMPWLMIVLLTIFWPLLVIRGSGATFGVAFGALLMGTQAANVYGVDGSGLWLHLQTITDRARARGEILGHVLLAVVPGIVVILLGLVLQSVLRDDWPNFVAALGVCLAALLGGCASSTWFSAYLPYAMPQSRKSAFASSVPGQKGRAAGASFAIMGVALLTAIPAAVAAVLSLTVAAWWAWVALALGVVVGSIALAFATRAAADRYLERGPEILALVSAGDRS
jgi:ABC-2 type transport system permease protein